MKSVKFALVLMAFGAMVFTSCKKDKEEPKVELQVKEAVVDARSFSEWVYFSFSKGEIVAVSDYKNDLNWDIAFHRWDVRTNGGESGKGQGAAVQMEKTVLAEVLVAPQSGYVADAMASVMVSSAMPPVYENQGVNSEMAKWMSVNTSQMPPVYTMSENVYVVKTAEGKYVKLKFTDFTNDMGERGVITFQYAFQADGSLEF